VVAVAAAGTEQRDAARDEPEREVKILLRRPVEESDMPMPTPVTPQRAGLGRRRRRRRSRTASTTSRATASAATAVGAGDAAAAVAASAVAAVAAEEAATRTAEAASRSSSVLAPRSRTMCAISIQWSPERACSGPARLHLSSQARRSAFGAPGQGRPMPSQPPAEFQPWPRRGAYASADADAAPPGQRVVLLQRPS
jgi:hypothetical protein